MNSYKINATRLSVGDALQEAQKKVLDLAGNPKATRDEIEKANENVDTLQAKFDSLDKAYREAVKDEEARLKPIEKPEPQAMANMSKEEKDVKLEAAFIRKTVEPNNPEFQNKFREVKAALNVGTNGNGGDNLLPSTMTTQLIVEPFATNPLRQMEQVSTITNLVMPRIAFDITGDNILSDSEVYKELKAHNDKNVEFGRFSSVVRTGIGDAVLRGTDTDLVTQVNNALSSALQLTERTAALTTTPKTGQEHMSFYDKTVVNIKEVTGTDLFDAITSAVADLDDMFADNAKVLMSKKDYMLIVKTLANGSATLYGAQPEQILGVPVVFCSAATTPIVGDFSYARLNYDIAAPTFEQYRKPDELMNYFQYAAWFDHQILLSSAFRLAKVGK